MATDRTLGPASPNNAITTETVSGEIQAGPLNTNFGNLEIAVETHLHGLNAQVGWDSMKSNFRPPDTGDSSNRWRMVCAATSYTVVGGGGSKVITFATDADQGDPSFTTAPCVTVTIEGVAADIGWIANLGNGTVTTSGFQVDIVEDDGGTHTEAVEIHWIAYGKVA